MGQSPYGQRPPVAATTVDPTDGWYPCIDGGAVRRSTVLWHSAPRPVAPLDSHGTPTGEPDVIAVDVWFAPSIYASIGPFPTMDAANAWVAAEFPYPTGSHPMTDGNDR